MRYLGIVTILALLAAPAMGWEEDFSYPDGQLRVVGAPPAGDWTSGTPTDTIMVNDERAELICLGTDTYAYGWASTFFGGVPQNGDGDIAVIEMDLMSGEDPQAEYFYWIHFQGASDRDFCYLQGTGGGFYVRGGRDGLHWCPLSGYGTWDTLRLEFDFQAGASTRAVVDVYYNGEYKGYCRYWAKGSGSMQIVDHIRFNTRERADAGSIYIDNIQSPPPIVLPLDILPDDDPNLLTVNVQGKGRLPMAILGTEEVPVSDIDADSLSIAGVVTPVKTPKADDVNGDGLDDLVIHVSRRDLIIALGLEALDPGTVVDVTVDGALLDGSAIVATDSVELVARED